MCKMMNTILLVSICFLSNAFAANSAVVVFPNLDITYLEAEEARSIFTGGVVQSSVSREENSDFEFYFTTEKYLNSQLSYIDIKEKLEQAFPEQNRVLFTVNPVGASIESKRNNGWGCDYNPEGNSSPVGPVAFIKTKHVPGGSLEEEFLELNEEDIQWIISLKEHAYEEFKHSDPAPTGWCSIQ